MALNLVRNSRLFVTTNLDTTNKVSSTGFHPFNTFEVQVLDGFTFSQTTNNETVTLNEAGQTPTRGQRSFNTSLAPVDFSFSTYIRPKNETTKITAAESVLWNAMFSDEPLYVNGTAGSYAFTSATYTYASNVGTIALTGTALPTTITSGTKVQVSGLTGTVTGGDIKSLNTYGTVTGTPSTTSFQVQLDNPISNAATITAGTAVITPVGNANAATVAVTGGTAAYTYNTTTKVGSIAVNFASGALTGVTTGEVYILKGITASTTGAVTLFNVPAKVRAQTLTSATLDLLDPPTAGSTLTVSTLTLVKSGWAEMGSSFSYTSTAASDVHELQRFGLLVLVDNVAYAIDTAVLNQATIDFGLDAISTIQWSGQGTSLRQISTTSKVPTAVGGKFGGGDLFGSYDEKDTTANYITNKLSTAKLTAVNDMLDSGGTTRISANHDYVIAITGGNITINNNVTFVTPAILGVVNSPVDYFTGTRAITGTLNAYLRTGSTRDTGELLDDLLKVVSNVTEPMFKLNLEIGGSTNATRVELIAPSTVISIPTVDVQQVVSTAINFTVEGSRPGVFDLEYTNDLSIKYYSAA